MANPIIPKMRKRKILKFNFGGGFFTSSLLLSARDGKTLISAPEGKTSTSSGVITSSLL